MVRVRKAGAPADLPQKFPRVFTSFSLQSPNLANSFHQTNPSKSRSTPADTAAGVLLFFGVFMLCEKGDRSLAGGAVDLGVELLGGVGAVDQDIRPGIVCHKDGIVVRILGDVGQDVSLVQVAGQGNVHG